MFKGALFLHIQKTAGTSIVGSVCNHYGRDIISHHDYRLLKPDDVRKLGFISGHFGYNYAQQYMEGRYCFTFLRNPIERVISFYHYARKEADNYDYPVFQLARKYSIEDFLDKCRSHPKIKPYIWNHQAWQLACGWANRIGKNINSWHPEIILEEAKSHLSAFDHVGFVESIDDDMQVIYEGLGIRCTGRMKRENAGDGNNYIAERSKAAQELLCEVTKYDQILYEYAWSSRGKIHEKSLSASRNI